jgi:hypothetical protein
MVSQPDPIDSQTPFFRLRLTVKLTFEWSLGSDASLPGGSASASLPWFAICWLAGRAS